MSIETGALVNEVVDVVLQYQGRGAGGPHQEVQRLLEAHIAELEAVRCCNSELAAGRALCGCKGAAATEIRRLREEAEKEQA